MAIDGSGTQLDPWVITTYAELVDKAKETGEYCIIDNDINITDEYPNGDMPQLVIKAIIDGNDKKISNWYKTSGKAITVEGSTAQLYDCTIANIYFKGERFIQLYGNNDDYHFVNCNFQGISWAELFSAIDDDGSQKNFSSCSFYIKSNSNYAALTANYYSFIGMQYCNIRITSTSSPSIFGTNEGTFVDSCYIEANIPAGSYYAFKNTILDLSTTVTFTANGNSDNDLSIINSTHAPNASAGNGFAVVDDAHWKDVGYLNNIGFNAG